MQIVKKAILARLHKVEARGGELWWKGLSDAEKRAYLKKHPNSKYGKQNTGTGVKKKKSVKVGKSSKDNIRKMLDQTTNQITNVEGMNIDKDVKEKTLDAIRSFRDKLKKQLRGLK